MNVRKVKYYNQGIVKVPPKDIKNGQIIVVRNTRKHF